MPLTEEQMRSRMNILFCSASISPPRVRDCQPPSAKLRTRAEVVEAALAPGAKGLDIETVDLQALRLLTVRGCWYRGP